MTAPSPRDRYRGALLGLAVGDCLGAPVEFAEPGAFAPVTGLQSGGRHRLPIGAWTDDTSLALCLAESLIESRGFDPIDQLERYRRWCDEGHLSSIGRCFDIGNATRQAIGRFRVTREPWCGGEHAGGNGSLMRLAPVPMAFAHDPERAVQLAADSSRTTHGDPATIDACRYFAALLLGALAGVPKARLLDGAFEPVPGLWQRTPLHPAVLAIANGSYRGDRPPPFQSQQGGGAIESLAIVLWAFWRSDDYASGVLAAVNVGRDTDTYGAILGQLAGACHGASAIPEAWRRPIFAAAQIEQFADRLLELASGQ